MKKSHVVGLAAGLSGSLFLASLAPVPAGTQSAVNDCPAINFDAEDYFAGTPATAILSKLGAFTMGVIASKCKQGEATVAAVDGDTMLLWQSQDGDFTNSDAPIISTYTLSVTGPVDPEGGMNPTQITSFGIQEYVSKGGHSGPAAEVSSKRVWSGWLVEAVQPFAGDPYNFTGNTGVSIAEQQADDIATLGKGIIMDALEGDVVGNQQRG
jgi:hypothetical protein